jgi:hypothetical protein
MVSPKANAYGEAIFDTQTSDNIPTKTKRGTHCILRNKAFNFTKSLFSI